MTAVADQLFADLSAWQAVLDRHQDLFDDMLPGSRIGLLPRSCSNVMPGKRITGLAGAEFNLPEGKMLAWEAREDGMQARFRPCSSFADAQADLLLLADDVALAAIHENLNGNTLLTMRRMIRTGNILFFVMKTKQELQDAGYEDFLDSLGLAFLGACR